MNFYTMTDKAIADELGSRIRSLRLRQNLTQRQIAEATMLSLNVIKSLESGRGKLASLIAVLRELGALQELDQCLPPATVSPLALARRQGKQRRRASGSRPRAGAQDAKGRDDDGTRDESNREW